MGLIVRICQISAMASPAFILKRSCTKRRGRVFVGLQISMISRGKSLEILNKVLTNVLNAHVLLF